MEVKLRNSTETVEEMIASEVLFNCVKGCLNKIRLANIPSPMATQI
jgi:hypothetical protein